MERTTIQIRTPIRRQNAEEYLLITLLSFAASVSLTRLFLDLTGYPQIGRGELHIAHVLWGGLLLFIAALLPLILANRWVYYWTSMISGLGVGLFIDEVGKFITRTNDYFYPAAAPIIYAFFLMTVLVYMLVKRRKHEEPRAVLYYILEDLQEVLDRDLSKTERARIHSRLQQIFQIETDPDLVRLTHSLHEFIESRTLRIASEYEPFWKRYRRKLLQLEELWFNRTRFRMMIIAGLAALGAWAIIRAVNFVAMLYNPSHLEVLLHDLIASRLVSTAGGVTWFGAQVGLAGSIGLVLLIAVVLMLLRKEQRAMDISYIALLFSLTVVNLLLFYFDQFSTINLSLLQFIVLIAVLRYRNRFLSESLVEKMKKE